MTMPRILIYLLILIAATAAWSKDKPVSAAELLAKSDALYFPPSVHKITDLAMDIHFDSLQTDPVGKAAQIAYYYAGEQNQWVEVNNIPDEQDALRQHILDEVTPVERFVMPTPSANSFAGMTLEMSTEARVMAGVPETTFYWVKGIVKDVSAMKAGDPKMLRVLLDRFGRLYQIEATSAKNERTTGSIENIQLDDGLHIAVLKTRYFAADGNLIWVFEHITYDTVNGVVLPNSVTIEYRDNKNMPVNGHPLLKVTFSNYRMNKGAAMDELAKLNKLGTSTKPPMPTPPMPAPIKVPVLGP